MIRELKELLVVLVFFLLKEFCRTLAGHFKFGGEFGVDLVKNGAPNILLGYSCMTLSSTISTVMIYYGDIMWINVSLIVSAVVSTFQNLLVTTAGYICCIVCFVVSGILFALYWLLVTISEYVQNFVADVWNKSRSIASAIVSEFHRLLVTTEEAVLRFVGCIWLNVLLLVSAFLYKMNRLLVTIPEDVQNYVKITWNNAHLIVSEVVSPLYMKLVITSEDIKKYVRYFVFQMGLVVFLEGFLGFAVGLGVVFVLAAALLLRHYMGWRTPNVLYME